MFTDLDVKSGIIAKKFHDLPLDEPTLPFAKSRRTCEFNRDDKRSPELALRS